MIEFLKLIVDKLRLDLLLAALGLSVLFYKLLGFDVWWMIFSFCASYLVLLWLEHLVKAFKKWRSTEREIETREARQKADDEYINNQIWIRFNSLSEYDLSLVRSVFMSEKDPHNPLVRYCRNNVAIKYQIEDRSEFRVPIGDRRYCPLLHPELLGDTTVITFHPYFERLVSHFVITGRVERVI